ncbi:MAG: flagellar hook-basal body complex protein [Bacillota bacterium]|nr:flagellar hook-basal body complex protein [Bacillota bacterium]
MLRILYNSQVAMNAQQDKLDTISNNIANQGTEGYKRTDVQFSDLVYESLSKRGYPYNNNPQTTLQTGTGVRASSHLRDEHQGNLKETDSSTDLAIDGDGYFSVRMPDGTTAYTRDGSFNIDGSGNLVDKNGYFINIDFFKNDGNGNLIDQNGNKTSSKVDNNGNILDANGKLTGINISNIKFSSDNFAVQKDGTVILKGDNQNVAVGRINLYTGISAGFSEIGNNLFVAKQGVQVQQAKDSDIIQGFLEGSNVDLGKEMTDLLITQRAFELSSKGMKTADDMWNMANNLKH